MATTRYTQLDITRDANGNWLVRAAHWFAVTVGQQIPAPNFASAIRGITNTNLQLLQAGSLLELVDTISLPSGSTQGTIDTALQGRWTALNTAFGLQPNPNTGYGRIWDGTTTTNGGPAPSQTTRLQSGQAIVATSGDSTLITGIAGQIISVDRIVLSAAVSVTVLVKDGAATTLEGFSMIAGVPLVLPFDSEPWFVTSAGNSFVLNLSAAVSVAVRGWWRQA
jgi:hypothetical protein